MFDELKTAEHQVSSAVHSERPELGSVISSFYDQYDESLLFKDTQHELQMFSAQAIRPANAYLLSELSPEELEDSLPADSPSRQWYVVGNFGTKDESLILDPVTQHLFLFDWVNYPNKQPKLSDDFQALLERLSQLDEEESVQSLLEQ